MTTEAGALLLPALLLSGRWRTLGGFASIVTAELIFYAVSYGRPLYRFTALGKNYLDDEMVRDANVDLFDRLVKEYPRMFVYPWYDLGYFGPLLVAAALFGLWRRSWLLVAWAAAVLAFYNFFSASLTHYVALPVASRLIYPGCVPLLILGAAMLLRFRLWPIVVAFVCGTSFLVAYVKVSTGFTAILSQNAKAAAQTVDGRVISDAPTLAAISFFHQFKPEMLIDLASAPADETGTIVVNGLFVDIREGVDGFFPFDANRKAWYERLDQLSPKWQSSFENDRLSGTAMNAAVWLRLIHSRDRDAMRERTRTQAWVKVYELKGRAGSTSSR